MTQEPDTEGKPCQPEPGTIESKHCTDGKCCRITQDNCEHGGVLDAEKCICTCPKGYSGDLCNVNEDATPKKVEQEIEKFEAGSKAIPLSPPPKDIDITVAAEPDEEPVEEEEEEEAVVATQAPVEKEEESSMMLIIIISSVVVLLACGGGGYYYYTSQQTQGYGGGGDDGMGDPLQQGIDPDMLF